MKKDIKFILITGIILIIAVVGLGLPYSVYDSVNAAPALLSGNEIKKERLTVTTTGADGSAGGTATTADTISGRIVRVDIDFSGSATTTTDLTLAEVDDLITTNIVSISNSVTDTQVFPTVQITDNAGTGRTYDGTRPVVDYYPVADELVLTLAQSTALTPAVTVEIYYME